MKNRYIGPEIWAGIECTINRVGDKYHQQLEKNGHLKRLDDLDKFAELGIKTIRYPILWEQIAPGKLEDADWRWADERLNKLRTLGICPVVGFVHHGSGPIHTSLTDPAFPVKLAAYANAFAARYPWIKYYTPVNEPLTTARFSGLYGHWYPHGRDNYTFANALINQCKGIILSFQAIKEMIPDAKLVQTEDLCKIYSTPLLAYQAAFENERRWLSLDLLCGKIKPGHPMWDELLSYNISEVTLNWFLANACLPEIIGINHYVTSNRYLDENLDQYPDHSHGGNAIHKYADVEAIRVPGINSSALYDLLKEVWKRYHLPMAITEVHLGGHREEQLRWVKECWNTTKKLYAEQVDIKAITAWSLLGSFDWNSLVTQNNNFYESGIFDISNGTLRPTALSKFIKELLLGNVFDLPLLNNPGFWQREDRFLKLHQQCRQPELVLWDTDGHAEVADVPEILSDTFPILIINDSSVLSTYFIECCRSRSLHYLVVSDPSDLIKTREVIEKHRPWVIVNTTTYKHDNVNNTQHISDLLHLVEICLETNIQLLAFISGGDPLYNSPTGLEKHILNLLPNAMIWKSDNSLEEGALHVELTNRCIDLLIDKVSLSY